MNYYQVYFLQFHAQITAWQIKTDCPVLYEIAYCCKPYGSIEDFILQ